MSNIESKNPSHITSTASSTTIESKTKSNVTSKTDLHIESELDAATERAAFLTTAKRNASVIFSKYL